MKKFLVKSVCLCTALIFSSQANAQLNLGNILKNVVSGTKDKTETNNSQDENKNGSIISTITNIFSGNKVATKDKIIGTWVYEEPAIVLSSDNNLKNIGGKLAASTIENKLKDKLEGYGLTKGCVKMTFDESGNFTQTVMCISHLQIFDGRRSDSTQVNIILRRKRSCTESQCSKYNCFFHDTYVIYKHQ